MFWCLLPPSLVPSYLLLSSAIVVLAADDYDGDGCLGGRTETAFRPSSLPRSSPGS